VSRPLSWFPLAVSDPVPGDPSTVVGAGNGYLSVAESIRTAAARLTEVAGLAQMRADAVDAIRERALEVAEQVSAARGRYVEVGSALTDYGYALDSAQLDSLDALRAAQSAQECLDQADGAVARALSAVYDDAGVDTADLAAGQAALNRARARRDDADAALSRARGDLELALVCRDQAAQRAVERIDAATDDGLNDGWWENWGATVAHALSSVAGTIASIAGILALVLCWVPVLSQALAVVAAIATAVKLVADIALAAHDEGTWGDVGFDAFALVTFGAGRVLSSAARTAAQGAKGAARLDAGRVAATSIADRAAQGLPTTSAASVIKALTGRAAAAMSRNTARSAAGSARSSLGDALADPACWRTLSPRALLADVGAMRTLNWSAFPRGVANVRSAIGGPGLLAASQGDMGLASALADVSSISRALCEVAPATGAAVRTATGASTAFGVTVGTGAANQVVGAQWAVGQVTGGHAPLSILAPGHQVSQLFALAPAQRLGLP